MNPDNTAQSYIISLHNEFYNTTNTIYMYKSEGFFLFSIYIYSLFKAFDTSSINLTYSQIYEHKYFQYLFHFLDKLGSIISLVL